MNITRRSFGLNKCDSLGCVANAAGWLLQWHRTPTTQETDGFQVKRPGDVSVRCTLLLMLDYQVRTGGGLNRNSSPILTRNRSFCRSCGKSMHQQPAGLTSDNQQYAQTPGSACQTPLSNLTSVLGLGGGRYHKRV